MLNHVEISVFVESRYFSAPKAFWRSSECEMQMKSHSIVRLPVHLSNEQGLYSTDGKAKEALDAASMRETILTAWFKLNACDPNARSFLCHDIPPRYIYFEKDGVWRERIKNTNDWMNVCGIIHGFEAFFPASAAATHA